MPDGSKPDAPLLQDQLCFALYATSRAFTKAYAELLSDLGVTYPQYLTLLVLWQHGDLGVQQIAEKLEIEGATATPMIKRMEALGLVTRTRSKADERSVVVSLTNAGQALREKASDIPERLGCLVNVGGDQAQKLIKELNAIRLGIS
ncbi:MarR family winged helix-turn-helix transcriptional regulator [Thalassococcus sp. S3]|uniref:MarR family winged helix-turn-helix transcriptional regulator n=1 Tax=Thalassococcus sp. S3 TaxID=2017482 RepID=UPI0010246F35|nr:MarR family transcriptional regulator [Thalassococcus sp. S3]QBF32549.1 MarR family transcriptional regulator [Thalassococcus sp. S3]